MDLRILKWAIKDLRGAYSSFTILLICLVIGISAITSVQISARSVLSSIENNSRNILGGDWVLRQIYAPNAVDVKNWFQRQNAHMAETIELRPMMINQITGDVSLVELKAVGNDYPLFGNVETHTGQDIHSLLENAIVIETSLMDRLNLKIGDDVQLGDASFKVIDTIKSEPDRAGAGRFGLAPRVFISLKNLETTKLNQQGSMIYHDLRIKFDEKNIPTVEQFENEFPQSTAKLTTHENASPQIQRFVNNLLQFMSLVGLSSLLIGGVGIVNGLRAYLNTRLPHIALYKMLGFSQNTIRKIYTLQIAMVGMSGILFGLFMGVLIPLFLTPFLQDFLPFPIEFHLNYLSLLTSFCFGILTIILFSVIPLGQAEKISPLLLFRHSREALHGKLPKDLFQIFCISLLLLGGLVIISSVDQEFAFYFTFGAIFCFGIFYGLAFFLKKIVSYIGPSFSILPRLAFKNISNPQSATIITLITLGIGLTILMSITLIDRNLRGTLMENMPDDAPSFFFLDIQPHQKELFQNFVLSYRGVDNLVITPNLRGRIKDVNGIPAEKALIDTSESWLLQNDRGFTYLKEEPAHSKIIEGSWWPADYKGVPLISVVDDVQRAFGIKVGDEMTLTILGRDIKAKVANIREVEWTNFTINFAITFSPNVLESAPYSSLATVIAPQEIEAEFQRTIAQKFPNISMVNVTEAVDLIQKILGQMVSAIRFMALLALFTGILVLISAIQSTKLERQYEITILKLLGLNKQHLQKIVTIEFAILGFLSAAMASLLSIAISWAIIVKMMDLTWKIYPLLSLTLVLTTVFFTCSLGLFLLRNILRQKSIDVLRNE